jgi:hypothetical protein
MMHRAVPHLLIASALLSGTSIASAPSRPAVVELFTSQGCSSCPPADAYLGELAQRSDVLALTYHVQYWDDLGWRDRFGLSAATLRQRNYATFLHLNSVYTPQVVIDGKADFVGSDRISIGASLSSPRAGVPVTIAVSEGQILVDLEAQGGAAPSDVLLVSYLRTAVSPIGRGENAGRTLKEFNIVRDIRTLGRWTGEGRQYRIPIDALPTDATDVAVLVQAAGQAPIIGAGTMALR